ncbi:alpha/beta fold hydrolase [Amycolatopsis sp. GM8]|uniref:alpha/beta fold hydrolase n=1 Tax=Amycolatopsis sp. GM8 TaxID=2896530 RepID=UPI001F437E77|nr:alpha/beta hydrolase [Amycolatopsis sp. GM8]
MHSVVTGPVASHGTLLLHGAGGAPAANFPFQAELPGRVVAPYYPGTGPVPVAPSVDVDSLVANALSAADDAGLATVDVVGYSLGAAVAVRLAARRPDRVRRLVLATGFAQASPSLRMACATWLSLLERAGDVEQARAVGRFLAWVSSSEQHWQRAGLDPDEVASLIAADIPPGTAALVDLIRRLDVRPDLGQVRAPTVIIVPTGDRLVHPAHAEQLAAGIAGARRVEVRAGHNLGWEAPDEFRTAIAEHLAGTG